MMVQEMPMAAKEIQIRVDDFAWSSPPPTGQK
jgi:hypothetical protein